jgi:hypothetical protein
VLRYAFGAAAIAAAMAAIVLVIGALFARRAGRP